MADTRSAAARSVLPASLTHVNHRNAIHDQFCRCFDCKPARRHRLRHSERRTGRDRAVVAIFTLLATGWMAGIYAIVRGYP